MHRMLIKANRKNIHIIANDTHTYSPCCVDRSYGSVYNCKCIHVTILSYIYALVVLLVLQLVLKC